MKNLSVGFVCWCNMVVMKISLLLFLITYCNSQFRPRDETYPEIFDFPLEKGKPIRLHHNYTKLTLKELNGTLYSDSLSQLFHITDLRIINNQIRKIEPGALCSLSTLRRLDLDFFSNDNPPAITESAFENCDDLEGLTIQFNYHGPSSKLAYNAFQNLPNLKSLYLQNANVSHITRDFLHNLKSLTTLNLESCNIKEIDSDAFDDVKNLESIYITRNRELQHLPLNLFKNTPKLETLNLRDNRIGNLTWEEFAGLSSVQRLDLSSNSITNFDAEKASKYMPNLKSIFIELNPLRCKQKEAFVNELQKKLNHSISAQYKFDPGFYDSCENEDEIN